VGSSWSSSTPLPVRTHRGPSASNVLTAAATETSRCVAHPRQPPFGPMERRRCSAAI